MEILIESKKKLMHAICNSIDHKMLLMFLIIYSFLNEYSYFSICFSIIKIIKNVYDFFKINFKF